MTKDELHEKIRRLEQGDSFSYMNRDIPLAVCVVRTSAVRYKALVIDDENSYTYNFTSKYELFDKVSDLIRAE